MKKPLEIHCFGSLRSKSKTAGGKPLKLEIEVPLPFGEMLHRLGIHPDQVQLIMINHCSVTPDSLLQPGDRVALFPPEYPVFLDWNDYRLRSE